MARDDDEMRGLVKREQPSPTITEQLFAFFTRHLFSLFLSHIH